MPLHDSLLNIGADAMAANATHLSLASADPGSTGANQTTAGRLAAGWGAATNGGDISISGPKAFTGGASNGAVTHVCLWTAATGGSFRGAFPVTGDASFNSAGEYTLDSFTIAGS